MSEKQIQEKIHFDLKTKNFKHKIRGKIKYDRYFNVNSKLYENLSMNTLLKYNYAKSVTKTLNQLYNTEYTIIGDVNPKNISLNNKERLYPDLILSDCERNFYIFELKVGSKTEREAITELFAYVFELKNHLPHINNSEISLIIISEEFGTLLSHAALQLISLFGINLLCLKLVITSKEYDYTLHIFNPIDHLTHNELRLHKRSFSSLSLVLYPKGSRKPKLDPDDYINFLFKVAESSIIDKANRINSNGFLTLFKISEHAQKNYAARYYISIFLLNPFEQLDYYTLAERGTPLATEILKFHNESSHHLQNHFFDIIQDSEKFLSKFYDVKYESSLTYEDFEKINNIYLDKSAIKCNCWGTFGEFMRNIIYNGTTAKEIIEEEIDHTDPYIFDEYLSQLLDSN